jgi:hypothetical protein
MTTHRIDTNETFVTEAIVRKSDNYTNAVLLKFRRHFVVGNSSGCDEMFLSTEEVENLAKFMLAEVQKIKQGV